MILILLGVIKNNRYQVLVRMLTTVWATNVGHASIMGDTDILLLIVPIPWGVRILMLRRMCIPHHSQQEEGISI